MPNLSDDHKAAMARGRELTRIVNAYLEAIDVPKRRGRPISREELEERLQSAEAAAEELKGTAKLAKIQEALDLQTRIDELDAEPTVDIDALRAEFVKVGAEYAEAKSITRAAFRSMGVPAADLKAAGI